MSGLVMLSWHWASPAAAADALGDGIVDTAGEAIATDTVEGGTEAVTQADDATTNTVEETTAAGDQTIRDRADAVSEAVEDTTDTGTEAEEEPALAPTDTAIDPGAATTGDSGDGSSSPQDPADTSRQPGAPSADDQDGSTQPSPPAAEAPAAADPDTGGPASDDARDTESGASDRHRLTADDPRAPSAAMADNSPSAPVGARLPEADHGAGVARESSRDDLEPSREATPPEEATVDSLTMAAPPVGPPSRGFGALPWLVMAVAGTLALAVAALVHARGPSPAPLAVAPAGAGLPGGLAGGGAQRFLARAIAAVDGILRGAYRWSQMRDAPYDSLKARTRTVVAFVTMWLRLGLRRLEGVRASLGR